MTCPIRLAVITGVMVLATFGWGVGGHAGAMRSRCGRGPAGGPLGAVSRSGLGHAVCPPAIGRWSSPTRFQRGQRSVRRRCSLPGRRGGCRDQVFGRPHQSTYFTGSAATETSNVLDIGSLIPVMRQSLGLIIRSISVVSAGARRRATGDYPRVYDTMIGTPPYAGQRGPGLSFRIRALDNGDALRWRTTAGATRACRSTTDRNDAALQWRTSADSDSHRYRGAGTAARPRALEVHNRRWKGARSDLGWQTTYAYRPSDITTENLAQAWSLRADRMVQNVTFVPPDGSVRKLTVCTPQAGHCAARRHVATTARSAGARGQAGPLLSTGRSAWCAQRDAFGTGCSFRSGPTGVLLGKTHDGNRLLMPLGDPVSRPGSHRRRRQGHQGIVIRAAAAGERVTVHTTDLKRWGAFGCRTSRCWSIRGGASGTTLSVVDGNRPTGSRVPRR